MDTYQVKLTFTEQILGTVPKSEDFYRDYIIGKALKEGVELTDEQIGEELQTLEKMERKGWTGFHQKDGGPAIYDYAFKGYLKGTCSSLRRISGTRSDKLQAHKKVIDNLVFVKPRLIPLHLNGGEMATLERPLRASTAKGDRVALAKSDTCPVGTTLEFKLLIHGVIKGPLLREWLDHGEWLGMGQWRSGGYGTFTYELEKA
jgi:hypothetical protein